MSKQTLDLLKTFEINTSPFTVFIFYAEASFFL